MCAYSALVDQTIKQWPGLNPQVPYMPYAPAQPGVTSWPSAVPNEEILREIRELGKRLDELDKKLGLRDCTQEEMTKRAFEALIDRLLADKSSKDAPAA